MITAKEAFDIAVECKIPELTEHCLQQIYNQIQARAPLGEFSLNTCLRQSCSGYAHDIYFGKEIQLLKNLNEQSTNKIYHNIFNDLQDKGFSIHKSGSGIKQNTTDIINLDFDISWKLDDSK